MSQKLTDGEGQALLQLARKTLEERLTGKIDGEADELSSELFQEERATFVTLKQSGKLRGCIGCLKPYEPLSKSIESNAINAAFHDSRFSPLTFEDFQEVQIDISILTPSKKLQYKNSDELVSLLRPGIDGVILRHDGKSGTFLPQVWEQLPSTELFLFHLCQKAGLPRDTWQNHAVEIEIYQVQSFEEGHI